MYICFIGSHDSFAFRLDASGDVAPSEPEAIRLLCEMLGSVAKTCMHQWSITQSMDITTQLRAGIRYFDLRLSSKKNSTDYFCVHGLYGPKIEAILQDLNTYLEAHPKEIVFLDFNHFYDMTEFAHKQLMSQILEVLGYKMCPYLDASSVTLNTMWDNNLQVIVFYHNPCVQDNAQFWPGSEIPSPWPNTMKPDDMVSGLEKSYTKTRPQCQSFFVYQGVLTPSTQFVIKHLRKSLRTLMSSKACQPYVKWLTDKKAGVNGINVCIMDFVEWADYINVVLKLNQKLAETL